MKNLGLDFFQGIYSKSSIPQAIIGKNRVISCNKTALEILGLQSLDKMQQLKPLELSPELQPDGTPSKQKRKEIIREALSKGGICVDWEFITPDGLFTMTELTITVLRHDNQTLFHVTAIDLSSRIIIQKALQESEHKFRTFIEKSPTTIMIYQNMKWVYANPTTTKLLGYTPDEIYQMGLADFIHPEDKDMILQRAQNRVNNPSETPNDYDAKILTKNGKIRWANIHFEVIEIDGKAAVLLAAIEITARKKAEQIAAEQEIKIRDTIKLEALSHLAGGIAHNLNNILSSIAGASALIKVATIQPKYTDIIDKSIIQAKNTIKHLLNFSQQGQQISTPINVPQLLTKIVELLENNINKNIAIQRITSGGTLFVHGDLSQIQNAILSIALNAIDAMPNGGILSLSIGELVLTKKESEHYTDFAITSGKYVQIRITDSGTGMDEKTLSHIFEPFFTTKEGKGGTGLGLPSAYGVAHNHNGSLTVTSQIGVGTVASLLLPQIEDKIIESASVAKKSPSENKSETQKTILIVDDNIIICRVTEALLKKMGYKVQTTYSGKEALALLADKKELIDLILLDMVMPGMTGEEVFKEVRLSLSYLPILIHSGYHRDANIDALLKSGNAGFIQKPYTYEKLQEEIKKLFL